MSGRQKDKQKDKSKSMFRHVVSSFVSLFSGKDKASLTGIMWDLWPKFQIIAPPTFEEEARSHWRDTWELIEKNDEEGWKRLGEMLSSVHSIEKKKTIANDRLHDVKRLLDEKIQATSAKLDEIYSTLVKEQASLKVHRFFDLPYIATSECNLIELDRLERRKIESRIKEEQKQLEDLVARETLNVKNKVDLLASELNNLKLPKVVIWLRGANEMVCQSFASTFLNDCNYEVRYWLGPESMNNLDVTAPTVLLNLYEVQTNILDVIRSDPDYIKCYKLFPSCMIIRLHEYSGDGIHNDSLNDDYDNEAPSTVRGLHTVLKLYCRATGSGVHLYDTPANQFQRFSKSHPTAEEKMKNFYFLMKSLASSSKEPSCLLQGLRDSIEGAK